MAKNSIFNLDPGSRNDIPISNGYFSAESYLIRQAEHIKEISSDLVLQFSERLNSVITSGGRVFFCGNGGSFGIAEHMVCDYAKGMRRLREGGFDAVCLGSNGSLHSALTNDFGHDNALSAELEMYAKAGDAIVAISSSGNSKNILNAVEYAKNNNIETLGLDGFGGGKLSKDVLLPFTSDAMTYPEVEACHQIFLDAVAFSLWV